MSLLPRFLAILALFGQLAATIGIPVPIATAKPSSLPYPCQGKKCGCKTSEACWAGACCCFTMRDKIAWAESHSVGVPAHARAIAAEEAEPEHECCAKAKACCPPKAQAGKPSSHEDRIKAELQHFLWLSVADVQGCHGKPADALGVMTMPPATTGKFVVLRTDHAPTFEWLPPFDLSVDSPSTDISTPPPKLG